MQSIEIDRSKRLKEEPHKGHNRWHYDLTPVVEVEEGEEVVLETRDASDGQTTWASTIEDMATMDRGAVHPLTGPVYVKGAKPGDLLEIEYLDILPQPYGFTRFTPGRGYLRDLFEETFLAHWEIKDGWATSPQVPAFGYPAAPSWVRQALPRRRNRSGNGTSGRPTWWPAAAKHPSPIPTAQSRAQVWRLLKACAPSLLARTVATPM